MAIWKDQTPIRKEPAPVPQEATRRDAELRAEAAPSHETTRRPGERDLKESVIAAGLTIQGKIEGSGHVRIAGRFQGDIHVQGDLTIEAGAKLTGGVRATTVMIGGELEGNIDAASRVDLRETGVLIGNLKAASFTVAAGSRMRGEVEFGWEEKAASRPMLAMEGGSAA
jgi:cytoskeletal protein CcmA (bactofilin family)